MIDMLIINNFTDNEFLKCINNYFNSFYCENKDIEKSIEETEV